MRKSLKRNPTDQELITIYLLELSKSKNWNGLFEIPSMWAIDYQTGNWEFDWDTPALLQKMGFITKPKKITVTKYKEDGPEKIYVTSITEKGVKFLNDRKNPHAHGRRHNPKISKKWLDFGAKVEMEHTKNYLKALKIASDHLQESPNYYKDWKRKEQILFQEKVNPMKRRLRRNPDQEIKVKIGNSELRFSNADQFIYAFEKSERAKFALENEQEKNRFANDYSHDWKKLSDSELNYFENAFNLNFVLWLRMENGLAFGFGDIEAAHYPETWIRYFGKPKATGDWLFGVIQHWKERQSWNVELFSMFNTADAVFNIVKGQYAYSFKPILSNTTIDGDEKETVQELIDLFDEKYKAKKYLGDLLKRAQQRKHRV